jgi:hypothetical protein
MACVSIFVMNSKCTLWLCMHSCIEAGFVYPLSKKNLKLSYFETAYSVKN